MINLRILQSVSLPQKLDTLSPRKTCPSVQLRILEVAYETSNGRHLKTAGAFF